MYTLEAALNKVAVIKTALAASKLRAIKAPFVLTPDTTRVQLLAAECDFSGYTAGGYAIANFGAPYLDPAGGATISAPSIQIQGDDTDPFVPNGIAGLWVESATSKVWQVWMLPETYNITGPNTGFPFVASFNDGANPVDLGTG